MNRNRVRLVLALCTVSIGTVAMFSLTAGADERTDELPFKAYAKAASRWDSDVAALERLNEVETHPHDSILFVGSSSIRLWKTIASDLAPYHPIRRGFGGAKISDVLVHLPRLISNCHFQSIVFFVGGNDVWGNEDDKDPTEIGACAGALIRQVRQAHAQLPIFFIEITPSPRREQLDARERGLNAALREACNDAENVHFIETREAFLNESGQRTAKWFADDQLHLNAAGYRRWAELIKQALDQKLQPEAAAIEAGEN